MATGKMSFNYYQNGKYGALPQNPQKDMEVTQDMHLKMSKKIAQLTKVIYALNTKNDENEAVLQTLRDQHEEEKQQILADMQAKMERFKNQLEGETDHRQRITLLQSRISDFEKQQSTVEDRFARLKEDAMKREVQQEEEHNRQIQQLTQDVLRAKREFEEHLQAFEAWKLQTEAEHAAALQKMETLYVKEMDQLRSFQRSQDSDWLNQCAQIEEKFKADLTALEERLAASQAEKLKMEEDYSQKLEKAQAFYEKELQVLKQNQNSSFEEELSRLREQQEKLKQDFSAQEGELRKQIDRLVRQLAETEDLAESRKGEIERFQNELGNKNSSAEAISQMLQAAQDESAAAKTRMRELETELAASKQRCEDQAADLLKKSGLIGELEATKLQKTAQVEELGQKLEEVQGHLSRLQAERSSILSQQKSTSSKQHSELTRLQKNLEDLMVEKDTMQQKYEKELASLRELMTERVKEVTVTLEGKLTAAEKQHAEERDRDRKTAAEVLIQTKQDLQTEFSQERTKLQSERDSIQTEFERVKADLLARCKQAEDEVKRLSSMVKESEEGLGSASTHINSLKEAAATLKSELDKTRAELKTTKIQSANVQAELDKLQVLHNSKTAEWQLELKSRLEKLAAELDAKWAETMRMECSKLRQELTAQKDDEKRAALEQLSKLKEEAHAAERASFENRMTQLNRQLSELRARLDKAHSSSEEAQNQLRAELEAERAQLQAEMVKSAEDYALKIKELEEAHRLALQATVEQKDKEKAEQEQQLTKVHREDMEAQMTAHKLAMQTAQETHSQQLKMQLREAEDRFKSQQEELRAELQQNLEAQMEKLRKSHGSEIRTARMELERAVEISKQKERDHQLRMEELQEEISQRETHIVKLKEELKRLQASILALNRTITDKDGDTHRVQKEMKEQMRQMEDRLKREHKHALDNQAADHLQESQEMVAQFNSAQELLKDKISELQIMLAEAEERYSQRDSRPEDLELIQQLREELQEKEMRVKQLIDEKRFYQLELVNRETNFNKVFNTAPNVGVLNPLTAKPRKKGDKGPPSKHMSAPSLASSSTTSSQQRLDPLPNSPLHDNNLNPSKPLPQPAGFSKKFVK
ncbi:protein FAM184A-like [Babylonia areolata]|uniref:protein FAM184A-like n=1 Tax=Babylonia areolata TaxID=304850 RepID=UPI003FD53CC4